ncbi:MAG: ATP-binding protein, partial [Anaeromyxobacteraceae bacterium]
YGRAVSERNYGGFGLGLWSAKRWVGAMGGHIEVESEVDVGTTVRIALPASLAVEAQPRTGGVRVT